MIRAFLQLIRLPNFLTVPGDILVGGLIAAGGVFSLRQMGAGIAASLCFYGFGVALNDVTDSEIDRRERPERPIPSGAISRGAALSVAVGFFALGFLFIRFTPGYFALPAAVILCALIAAYNCGLKRVPVAGVLTMGACRGANILLGTAAVMIEPDKAIWLTSAWVGGFMLTYIFALSAIARREAEPGAAVPLTERFLPALVFAALLGMSLREPVSRPAVILAVFVFLFLVSACRRAGRGEPLPRAIGQLLQGLILIQAWLCAVQTGAQSFATAIPSLALLAAAALFGLLTRIFYAS